MIIAETGGQTPVSTGPKGACSSEPRTNVYRFQPPLADWEPTATTHNRQIRSSALTLQRLRERLEIAALEARRPRPEQVADRQLLQEVGL